MKALTLFDILVGRAAIAITMGENPKVLQKQMGHANLTTTMNTYGHLLPDATEGFGQRLDSKVLDEKIIPFPDTKTGATTLHIEKNGRK